MVSGPMCMKKHSHSGECAVSHLQLPLATVLLIDRIVTFTDAC